jgi:hypothetical protein
VRWNPCFEWRHVKVESAALSISLHVAVVALLFAHLPTTPQQPPAPDGDATSGVPLDVFIIPGDGAGPQCDGYDGVGIRHALGGHILDVAPRSPAERAGIAAGDVLLDPLGIDLRQPAGTTVRLSTQRGNYVLVTARICTGKT